MRRVSWARPARDDLYHISEWLEQEATPEFAVRTLTAIRSRADFLVDFPHGGRPYRDATRVLRVLGTPYLIHYRLIDDAVQVLRVHHEREDWLLAP